MPGHYSTRCRRRPCRGLAEAAEGPARLFLCARCQAQVLVCSCCDRGQIYCASGCAREARRQAQRAANAANNFLDQLAAAERKDANLDFDFFFAGFHCYSD